MSLFGIARVKYEGAPMHPDEIYLDCDVPDCPTCEAFLKRQGLEWLADQRKRGISEDVLKQEEFYDPPSDSPSPPDLC